MTSSAQKIVVIPDSVVREDNRLGIHVGQRRIAECSFEALGLCLSTLRGEGQLDGLRVGVFDRQARVWLISPYQKGAS